jgi:hypothetical protein
MRKDWKRSRAISCGADDCIGKILSAAEKGARQAASAIFERPQDSHDRLSWQTVLPKPCRRCRDGKMPSAITGEDAYIFRTKKTAEEAIPPGGFS